MTTAPLETKKVWYEIYEEMRRCGCESAMDRIGDIMLPITANIVFLLVNAFAQNEHFFSHSYQLWTLSRCVNQLRTGYVLHSSQQQTSGSLGRFFRYFLLFPHKVLLLMWGRPLILISPKSREKRNPGFWLWCSNPHWMSVCVTISTL